MSPSAYLAAAVYYFLFNTVNQKKTVVNQMVAELFKISKSNLHRITSGRKYAGGSVTAGKKIKSVQELEDHREEMVKIAKVKPKAKAKKMMTVTKTMPKIIPLPYLDDTPGEAPRRSQRRKDRDKKDDNDQKLMVHYVAK